MLASVRILHLSDLHWGKAPIEDQKYIIGELQNDLKVTLKDRKPDIIVFSGDLVNAGTLVENFSKAKTEFLDKVLETAGASDNQLLICPGNHDVDKPFVESNDYVEVGLAASLHNRDKLNGHIDRYFAFEPENDPANARLSKYFSFLRKSYHKDASLRSSYVDCFKMNTPLGKLGFAIFNTAWRSRGLGEPERNTLLLGQRAVDKAAEELADCDLKIAVMHHPVEWLAPWDRRYTTTPLLMNFDLVFFGHAHEAMPTLTRNAMGECIFLQSGCLYEHQDYFNGYQIVDLSVDNGLRTDLTLRTWFNHPKRKFGPAENICDHGLQTFFSKVSPKGERALKTNELILLQNAIDDYANKQINTLQKQADSAFDSSFTCPPLSPKTHAELIQLPFGGYKENLVSLESIYEKPGLTIVVGARESGKTSIALKIAKELLKSPVGELRIPIMIDFAKIKSYDSLDRGIRRFFSAIEIDISAKRVFDCHRCLFLIDNVSIVESEKLARVKELISQSAKYHDWVIFFDEVEILSKAEIVGEFSPTQPPIFIQPLGRTDIRSLVSKFSIMPDSAIETTDVIVKLINDNNLPKNPYIVTMLISVFSSAKLDATINEASLLDKLIDILLNKQDPDNLIVRSSDFAGLNIILEEISLWLSENDQYLGENDLIGRLVQFFDNRGIKDSAADLFRRFIAVGILDKVGDEICFRHRSFEAYFLAKYAARNNEFVPKLIEGLNILKYKKEFSLLCDLSRKDEDLLTFLEVTISELEPGDLAEFDKKNFLGSALGYDAESIIEGQLTEISSGPKGIVQIDELADIADRAKASVFSKSKTISNSMGDKKDLIGPTLRIAGYIEAWRVWGRALTSLDFVHLKVRQPSFVKLLAHWARIAGAASEAGSRLFKEVIEEYKKEQKEIPAEMQKHLEYVARISVPLSIAQSIFEYIGASSVHQLLLDTYDELPNDSPEAVGALILLIKHRPVGWDARVEKFIAERAPTSDKEILFHLLLQTLSEEYRYRILNNDEVRIFEKLLAQLIGKAKNLGKKVGALISQLEQKRSKLQLGTKNERR